MTSAEAASSRVVATRELQLLWRDRRLVVAALSLLIASAGAMLQGWAQFERAEAERLRFEQLARNQWLHQGERHPHRAAHFGTYVAKPQNPLALFEPGLSPFAGQTLWLEAHDRPAFTNVPAEDDLTLQTGLGVASAAAVMQMMGGLLALILGAQAIVRDRESGVLRLVLAQGVSPIRLALGKLKANGALLVMPLLPVFVIGVGIAVASTPAAMHCDVVVRGIALGLSSLLLLGIMLLVGLSVSAFARTSRAATITAFAIWTAVFVVIPRVGSSLASRIAPSPTLAQYQEANSKVFDAGFDARGGYLTQLDELRAHTLWQYHVKRVEDLPVGFSGIRMRHLDAWSTEVDDRAYARLQGVYRKQAHIRLAAATLSPFIAARNLSQAFAATDWPHYGHFLVAAEAYRRAFGAQMNALLEARVRGDRWEMDGSDRDWATVRSFSYEAPSARWAMGDSFASLIVLTVWLALAHVLLAAAARRMSA